MQEEVIKHTNKIYKTMKDTKHTFREKVKEVIIEIFIIVFAVTLSINLHSWTEHKHQQSETTEFLIDLKDDLNKDIKSMQDEKNKLSKTVEQYMLLQSLSENQIESIGIAKEKINLQLNPTFRKTNDGNYDGFKSSGKIGFIENKKLKKLILEYYQENMSALGEIEKFYNSQIYKLGDMASQNSDIKKMFLDPRVKATFDITIQSANNEMNAYEGIIKQAKVIITEIDKKTKE
jgi:hypothetical protein